MIICPLYKVAQMSLDMDAKFLMVSTSEVYGRHPEDEVQGQKESLDLIIPAKYTVRLEYGVSKALSEIILRNLSLDNNLKYNCIRPFNIVGPSQNDDLGFVIPRFLRQALDNKPITVYGDGASKRTFTHVSDIVDSMFAIMESNAKGEIFNVGNPNNVITIKELAYKIKSSVESESEVVFVNPKEIFGKDFDEAWNKIPNVDKIFKTVGWGPKYSLDYIINELANLRNNYLVR